MIIAVYAKPKILPTFALQFQFHRKKHKYRALRKSKEQNLDNAFVKEYEFKASQKLLFPFISTSRGLVAWFADKAVTRDELAFTFTWDGDEHFANLVSNKLNKAVKFEFAVAPEPDTLAALPHPFIEFSLSKSPVSESVFLRICDTTESKHDDVEEVWDSLVSNLKTAVGG